MFPFFQHSTGEQTHYEKIIINIDCAVQFIATHKSDINKIPKRKELSHLLTNDLLLLDTLTRTTQRREYIIAIQNILEQLDTLFDENKTSILLTAQSTRTNYLPDQRDSHYALGLSFNHK